MQISYITLTRHPIERYVLQVYLMFVIYKRERVYLGGICLGTYLKRCLSLAVFLLTGMYRDRGGP